ncbi:hypothetical protein, partial [Streptomyces sp. NPDC003006]
WDAARAADEPGLPDEVRGLAAALAAATALGSDGPTAAAVPNPSLSKDSEDLRCTNCRNSWSTACYSDPCTA